MPQSSSCSPHTRGWTALFDGGHGVIQVFPAYAGMDRRLPRLLLSMGRVPRIRGDGPTAWPTTTSERVCSPHTRGWTVKEQKEETEEAVFPAYAGMDRYLLDHGAEPLVFPAYAGMDRSGLTRTWKRGWCSPHTRGWTGFLDNSPSFPPSVPRIRGDGPLWPPHPEFWHWVFPAYAGMDRAHLAQR